jgi:hypothetical protein
MTNDDHAAFEDFKASEKREDERLQHLLAYWRRIAPPHEVTEAVPAPSLPDRRNQVRNGSCRRILRSSEGRVL